MNAIMGFLFNVVLIGSAGICRGLASACNVCERQQSCVLPPEAEAVIRTYRPEATVQLSSMLLNDSKVRARHGHQLCCPLLRRLGTHVSPMRISSKSRTEGTIPDFKQSVMPAVICSPLWPFLAAFLIPGAAADPWRAAAADLRRCWTEMRHVQAPLRTASLAT